MSSQSINNDPNAAASPSTGSSNRSNAAALPSSGLLSPDQIQQEEDTKPSAPDELTPDQQSELLTLVGKGGRFCDLFTSVYGTNGDVDEIMGGVAFTFLLKGMDSHSRNDPHLRSQYLGLLDALQLQPYTAEDDLADEENERYKRGLLDAFDRNQGSSQQGGGEAVSFDTSSGIPHLHSSSNGIIWRPTPRSDSAVRGTNGVFITLAQRAQASGPEKIKIQNKATQGIRNKLDVLDAKMAVESKSVALRAQAWVTSLKALDVHSHLYSCGSVFQFPDGTVFTPRTLSSSNCKWKSLFTDFQGVDVNTIKAYQRFFNANADNIALESDTWMRKCLENSCSTKLWALVSMDLSEVPIVDQGALLVLYFIISRIISSNKEAVDVLLNFIKEFKLSDVPGEDVSTSVLQLKSVCLCIGKDNLPKDLIRRLLEGFGCCQNDQFKVLVSSLAAFHSSSSFSSILTSATIGLSLYDKTSNILADLENKYLELIQAGKWDAVNSILTESAFTLSPVNLETDLGRAVFSAYLASASRLSFEDWAKTCTCNYCHEKGHVTPQCPKYKADVASGKTKPFRQKSRRSQREPDKSFRRDQKKKTDKSAFNAFFQEQIPALYEQFSALTAQGDTEDAAEDADDARGNDDDNESSDECEGEVDGRVCYSATDTLAALGVLPKE